MSPAPLRLRLLGPFTVEGEGEPVPVGNARRVLALLAVRLGELVPLSTIVDALWEGDPPERADRNIAALISRIRRAVGRNRIDGTSAAYRLLAAGVSVDLHQATELVQTAELELRQGRYAMASTSAEQAARMLAADVPLVGEREDTWVLDLRRDVRRLLRRARICWSAACCELHGSTPRGGGVGRAADDPFRRAGLPHADDRPPARGRSGSALVAYRALRVAMSEQLGSDPSAATQALFLSILRGGEPGRTRPAGPRGHHHDAGAGGTPLVGRDDELATLAALWRAR